MVSIIKYGVGLAKDQSLILYLTKFHNVKIKNCESKMKLEITFSHLTYKHFCRITNIL